MTKIVLIGAGSLQFGTAMLGDIFTSDHLCDVEIVLNDINKAGADRTATVAREFIKAHNLEHTLHVESDLHVALQGADFAVISIEVGDRFALWDMDWKIPQQYGISQVYG